MEKTNELLKENSERLIQNEEKKKLAAELIIADKELVFQKEEKRKRAAELIVANKELIFQNKEKEKRAEELIIANKELVFQNEEKEKRAKELIIANKELIFQNREKGKRAKEYSTLNKKLTESINRIQKINEELILAKIKAEESDMLKSAFLANMSHEIRTPMNAIMGFSDLLLQSGLSCEKIANYVKIINSSGQQLLSVISDIIDISKIESGQIIIDSDLINVDNLLTELYVTYKKLVDLKKIEFSCSCDHPKDIIQIKTDGNRIKQVLCNLLNNAIKFTKEGEIKFGFNIKPNFIEFFVSDTGIGIAPENHVLIFNRFRQVEATNNRSYGGNGLGLSISKALVEKLGGTITVHSELERGTIFTFTIPYVNEMKEVADSASEAKMELLKIWNKKTLLIVEDEINNTAYIEELLSATGVQIVHACNGSDAVEMVKSNSDISLVLMDIKMPVMDGYEATRLIKKIRPELPVIAQTAYALSHDRAQILQAGFDNYISKPIPQKILIDLIAGYLNK